MNIYLRKMSTEKRNTRMAEVTNIFWTKSAKNDLKEIYIFLCDTINEPKAFEIISNLIEKVEYYNLFLTLDKKNQSLKN